MTVKALCSLSIFCWFKHFIFLNTINVNKNIHFRSSRKQNEIVVWSEWDFNAKTYFDYLDFQRNCSFKVLLQLIGNLVKKYSNIYLKVKKEKKESKHFYVAFENCKLCKKKITLCYFSILFFFLVCGNVFIFFLPYRAVIFFYNKRVYLISEIVIMKPEFFQTKYFRVEELYFDFAMMLILSINVYDSIF